MVALAGQLKGDFLLLEVGEDEIVDICRRGAVHLVDAVGGLRRKVAFVPGVRHSHVVVQVAHIPDYFLGNLLFIKQGNVGMVGVAINWIEPAALKCAPDPLEDLGNHLPDLLEQFIAVFYADGRIEPFAQLDAQGVDIAAFFFSLFNVIFIQDGLFHRVFIFQVRKKPPGKVPEKLVGMKSQNNVKVLHPSLSLPWADLCRSPV